MKKSFACSLVCHNGIIGGGLFIEDTSVAFRTNKLTVDRKYKNLVLPLDKISQLTWKRVVFPVATFQTVAGERYSFIIFNKKGFCKCYAEVKPQ